MTTHATDPEQMAILRGVLENPADDAPRLALADWYRGEGDNDDRADSIERGVKHPDDWTYCDGWHLTGDKAFADVVEGKYRRGFVGEIHLTAAAFMGGPCDKCDGSGLVRGNEQWGCMDCGGNGHMPGSGRLPGLARRLFEGHPLISVVMTDRKPLDLSEEHEFPTFLWLRAEDQRNRRDDGDMIPAAIFDLLEYDDDPTGYGGGYTSEERCQVALNHAATNYGRTLAGLPPLERGGRK